MFDIKEMWIKQIETQLEQYCYWQMEQMNDILNGEFTMCPAIFMIERIHQLALLTQKLGTDADKLNWYKMYQEASERARRKRFEENNTITAKVD